MEITAKQKRVLDAIQDLTNQLGKPPTLEELKGYLEYGNTSSVQRHVYALIRKGFLTSDRNKARSYTVAKSTTKTVNIPLLGECPCGEPFLAQENIEAYVPYDANKLQGDARNYFFLRAIGDSMNLAGVDDGDYVLIRKANAARTGEIVVALIGDEATVKRLRKKNEHYVLEPESTNPRNKPIYALEGLSIQGILVGVVKKRSRGFVDD